MLVTLAVRALAHVRDGVDVPFLARMAPWMPFAVRMHLAVSLIGLLSLGVYLSPAMDLEANLAGILLGANMAIVAILMATGWHTREGAWLLIVLGPLGMIEFGVSPVLQRLDVLGLAVFVLCTGPGRWSADMELGIAREPTIDDQARGVWALRVGAGLALIVVAFAEKLANPELALAFLADHPDLNVAQAIGLDWSDLRFIRVAGAIEVLFGLLLISGALPQAVVVIAGVPFNASLWFFGVNELLGHLPVYGGDAGVARLRLRPRAARPRPGPVAVDGARNRAGELGGDATARREAALARAVELAVRQRDRARRRRKRGPGDAGRGGVAPLALPVSWTLSVSVIASPPVGLKVTLSVWRPALALRGSLSL